MNRSNQALVATIAEPFNAYRVSLQGAPGVNESWGPAFWRPDVAQAWVRAVARWWELGTNLNQADDAAVAAWRAQGEEVGTLREYAL